MIRVHLRPSQSCSSQPCPNLGFHSHSNGRLVVTLLRSISGFTFRFVISFCSKFNKSHNVVYNIECFMLLPCNSAAKNHFFVPCELNRKPHWGVVVNLCGQFLSDLFQIPSVICIFFQVERDLRFQ